MKTFGRAILFCVLFFVSFSVGYVLILKVLPVTITPLEVVRLFRHDPQIPARVNSRWVPLERIAPAMAASVIASEDNHFLTHNGFDWQAIRLAWKERRQGRRYRGGSTISQQTAKNVFCYPASNWLRKGVEAWYTVLIETLWSKRRIMEVYLNIVELGPNVYGVEAACWHYFGKSADKLSSYEASLIAAVLPNPLRMKLSAPSSYVTRRAATIRRLRDNLPPVEW